MWAAGCSARAPAPQTSTARRLRRPAGYCHKRGVKLYMTVNTLVRDEEMDEVYAVVREAVSAGIDAAIVQDLGVAALLRSCFPKLHLHASTQMAIATARGAAFARAAGMTRVVPPASARSRRSSASRRWAWRSRCSSTARCASAIPASACSPP